MTTIHCKLVAEHQDLLGYITYVFESLDKDQESFLLSKYLMAVRFPNWDQGVIELGDSGFLTFKEVIPGINKWFDWKEFVDYNSFEGFQFIRFVKEKPSQDNVYVL